MTGKKEREACVDAFANEMKLKLAENAHKGDREGWKNDSRRMLMKRLREEVEELHDAVELAGMTPDQTRIITREAADVANFAMMIADVVGGLDVK